MTRIEVTRSPLAPARSTLLPCTLPLTGTLTSGGGQVPCPDHGSARAVRAAAARSSHSPRQGALTRFGPTPRRRTRIGSDISFRVPFHGRLRRTHGATRATDDQRGRRGSRRVHADRLARAERAARRRAGDLRPGLPHHRRDRLLAEHAGSRPDAGSQPRPRRGGLRPGLLRTIARAHGHRPAGCRHGLRDLAQPHPSTRDRRCPGHPEQPLRAPGGRRHLGHPPGRQQPRLVTPAVRSICRYRSCSWAAWPVRHRCPRSVSTTGPSAAWPQSICWLAAPSASAWSPGR